MGTKDIEEKRAENLPYIGKDPIYLVFYHAACKLLVKTFSLSAVWAVHGMMVINDYLMKTNGEQSWLPYVYGGAAWINLLLRPQFKQLIESAAKRLEKN